MRRLTTTAGILLVGGVAGFGLVRAVGPSAASAAPPARPVHGAPVLAAPAAPAPPERLAPPPRQIDESSGLAASRERPGWLWTHNDSGGGELLARYNPEDPGAPELFTLGGVKNRDWEDLSSFEIDGRSILLVADTGDNRRNRRDATVHFVEEPAADADTATPLQVLLSVPIAFADGPRDCEAVAVDVTRGLVLLGSKEIDQHGQMHGASGLYTFPIPDLPDHPAGRDPLRRLDRIGVLPTLMPTGIDVSADGRRLAIATYGDAMVFSLGTSGSWAEALEGEPERPATPPRRQGESVAFSLDGGSLFFTSEGLNQPTWRITCP